MSFTERGFIWVKTIEIKKSKDELRNASQALAKLDSMCE